MIELFSIPLQPLAVGEYSLIFASIYALALLIGIMFAWNNAKKEAITAVFYATPAIVICFASDLLTMFIMWEIMAIFSTLLVFSGGEKARKAGIRYAAMHFFGGVLLLCGIVALYQATGDISIRNLSLMPEHINANEEMEGIAAAIGGLLDFTNPEILGKWLILTGILINCAMPPFSPWLSESYPAAKPEASVFLSAFTTKTAIFVLLNLFAGNEILLWTGFITALYASVYALLENNIRRILAYSLIAQLGIMISAIGIGSSAALDAVSLHAFVHIAYKGLLFMCAANVIRFTGHEHLPQLGGLRSSMPFTCAVAVIAAASMVAMPFTSGFISKYMLSKAFAAEGVAEIWLVFLFIGVAATIGAALRFVWFTFFGYSKISQKEELGISQKLAMILMLVLCFVMGLYPALFGAKMPYISSFISQYQLIFASSFIFFALIPLFRPKFRKSHDFDWLYRQNIAQFFGKAFDAALNIFAGVMQLVKCAIKSINPSGLLVYETSDRTTALMLGLLGIFILWII